MGGRLCRCGAIVKGRCPKCQPQTTEKKTAERGYGNDWRVASERYRRREPLCQVCLHHGRTTPATEVHHIQKIRDAPELRLKTSNMLSVCEDCHAVVEQDKGLARRAKRATVDGGQI